MGDTAALPRRLTDVAARALCSRVPPCPVPCDPCRAVAAPILKVLRAVQIEEAAQCEAQGASSLWIGL